MKRTIIIVGSIIMILIGIILFVNSKTKKEIKTVKYSVEKVDNYDCQFSYGKICFGIPDDYKCVGNNNCQLSNEKDMLLVQVYVDENYEDTLDSFIKSGKNNFATNLIDKREINVNGSTFTTAKNRFQDERYYFIKIEKDVYSIKILSKKDSGNKFEELTKTIEETIKIKPYN